MSDDAAIAALVDQMKVAPKAPTEKSGVRTAEAPAAEVDEDEEELEEAADPEEEADEADPKEEADEDDDPDAEEGDEGDDADEPKAPAAVEPPADDAVVKITVNGEETEVTVGSLKRLAGQEATLTRKSQEADQVGGRAAMLIQGALDTIIEDLEPYNGFDWVLAGQEMEPEEFKWHRENYTRSEGRYNALVKQAGEFEQIVAGRKKAAFAEQAAEATAELQADIPGWSEALYGEIMQYGIDAGLDPDDVASIANAKVIKVLHKAMLADRASTAVAKKVNLTPARVKKPSGSDEQAGAVSSRAQRKLEQKLATGRATDDDAVALLMGRWKAK